MCIKITQFLLNNLHYCIICVVIAGEFFCITALSHSQFVKNEIFALFFIIGITALFCSLLIFMFFFIIRLALSSLQSLVLDFADWREITVLGTK